jgi:hypothetical protein
MQPREIRWTFTTPVQAGVDAYRAGFEHQDFSGQFALEGDGVLVDDWLLRDRAMTFASNWKFEMRVRHRHPRDNPTTDSDSVQYQQLFDEHRAELDATYERLLPATQGNPDTAARFLRERQDGDYPEEVYQQVAYAHLRELQRLTSGFYALAKDQRTSMSARQVALESLLTLQRYSPSWRFYLMELTTQSQLLASSAAVIDQMVDPMLAVTFAAEQLKAILGMEVYADANLYDRMRYAVLADELFEPRYLQEQQPAIYQELLKPDGTLKRVADLPRDDQLRILRAYLTNANGGVNMTGVLRMRGVFAARIHEDDLRALADVIHHAKVPES